MVSQKDIARPRYVEPRQISGMYRPSTILLDGMYPQVSILGVSKPGVCQRWQDDYV